MNVEGWMAPAGYIRTSHVEPGDHDLNRRLRVLMNTRLETRESAAGADPDRAVRLRREGVLAAVVPDQSIAYSIVVPARAIPHIHAVIAARPNTPRRVGFDEIHNSIRARSLDVLLDGQPIRPQMDAIHSDAEAIGNPYRPLGAPTPSESTCRLLNPSASVQFLHCPPAREKSPPIPPAQIVPSVPSTIALTRTEGSAVTCSNFVYGGWAIKRPSSIPNP